MLKPIRNHNLLLIISTIILCIVLTGCMKTYTFNGSSYANSQSAIAAVDAFYSNLENDVSPAKTKLPMDIVVVIPGLIYAKNNWVLVQGNPSMIKEDQYQFIAYQLVRDSKSVSTHLSKSNAFKSVITVEAKPDSISLPSSQYSKLRADIVLKKTSSGHWELTRFPAGPATEIQSPTGLSGKDYMTALVANIQETARPFLK